MDEHRHTSDLKPGVDLRKKTTKVNFWMVIGVAIFLAIAVILTWRMVRQYPENTPELQNAPG